MKVRCEATWRPRRWACRRLHAVFTVPFVVGCTELPPHVRQEVDKAREQYQQKDYSAAKTTLDGVLASYSHFKGSAEAYYLRAKILAETSNKSAALKDAERCIELAYERQLTAKACATAGSLEFEAGSDKLAMAHYAQALSDLPEKPPTDLIRYRYAVCLQRQGKWTEARREFATVVQRYPGGDLAKHAQRMFEWPVDYFAIQCGAFQDRRAATELTTRLNRSGLSACVEARSRMGKPLHMVFVGQFTTHAEAERQLQSVRNHVSSAVIAP